MVPLYMYSENLDDLAVTDEKMCTEFKHKRWRNIITNSNLDFVPVVILPNAFVFRGYIP